MGLGGWMLQEGYMLQTSGFANAQFEIRNKIEELIGETATNQFYDAWLENHMQKVDIDSLKSWGFNSVRLPMHYKLYTLPIEEEPVPGQNTWLDKGFALTDSLISWCAQNEMYVILDLHGAPGGQGYESAISDYDPSKPSLWESQDNKDKTVALWRKLAERYQDEVWVGGYDLINEPNWNLPGGNALKDLYVDITNAIREVDNNHMIIIEGNWFANDFTGLTPPWDSNMAYGPHKYWSYNDPESIQWVLSIRDNFNVPIWVGESGENSNTWFRDAIRLMEDHNIGWAWWPLKKVESISCPLSVKKNSGYQTLLDYWNGTGTQPDPVFATNALMELANDLKLENCEYHKDVPDAMIRQVYSDDTKPYTHFELPGVIYASDFDLGVNESAYSDSDVADYHLSSGSYTAWNNGWAYRNDGVDIEVFEDAVNSNGYSVGWFNTREWMQYDIGVASDAVFDIKVRVASTSANGKFHLSANGAEITKVVGTPNTGGWYTYQDVIIPDVMLSSTDNKLRFHADNEGFNFSSMEFIYKGETTDLLTDFLDAFTFNDHTIQLNLNKPLADPIPVSPSGFEITIDESTVTISDVYRNISNPRSLMFTMDETLLAGSLITISYSGTEVKATDGTDLNNFLLKRVRNTLGVYQPIPGRIEAEDYFFQSGVQLENTTDVGGGQNVGFLDVGDYMDYNIDVTQSGLYNVQYRTAAESNTGKIQLQRINSNGDATIIQYASFAPTGGWQTWATTSKTLNLEAGQYHIRILITAPQFNINWIDFSLVNATQDLSSSLTELNIMPNPGNGLFKLTCGINEYQDIQIRVFNMQKQLVLRKMIPNIQVIEELIDIRQLPDGNYFLEIISEDGSHVMKKILKIE
jgi:hypothetical protein